MYQTNESSGAVVYKIENNQIYYAIVQSIKNLKYGFPKGHLEPGEPFLVAAKREIKEEANLDVDIFEDVYYDVSYKVLDETYKFVRYYLGKASTFDLIAQHDEVKEALWLTYEDAMRMISYDNNKIILENFHKIVLKRYFNE